MSKKRIKETLSDAGITRVPADLGPSLKALAEVCEDIYKEQVGDAMYLPESERKEAGSLEEVHKTDIEILVAGKSLRLVRDNPGKPAIVIPYGMSDKVTTAAMPWSWVCSILYQSLVTAFGEEGFVQDLSKWINGEINKATKTDNGRIKIDTSMLPAPKNAIAVSEFLESLKRTSVSKSRGSTRINLAVSVSDARQSGGKAPSIDDIVANTTPEPTMGEGSDEVSHSSSLPADKSVSSPSTKQTGVSGTEGTGGGGDSFPPPSSTLGEDIDGMIMGVFTGEPLSIGQIRKRMPESVSEVIWRSHLDGLVNQGVVSKEGVRRSTKYSLTMEVIA
tara:strand:- start:3558 stop:4556 length:999 start_codon:yes stop_codon:yes gene_type:complete